MDEPKASTTTSVERGTYALGYSEATNQWMSQRTAATHAAFFLPHLSPGMRLLDCGCGSGSITLGLAEAVAPGEVVGIDIEPLQIERAQAQALAQDVHNIRFEVAHIQSLPFPNASFDAVFAHAVLYHLTDPRQALQECRRVLKPNGLVGIRDTDYSVWLLEPATPQLDAFRVLSLQVASYNGASPIYARRQRAALVEAGFGRTVGTASCVSRGTLEETRSSAQSHIARLRTAAWHTPAIEQEWATTRDLDEMELELQAWGERHDSFEVVMWRAAVGWVTG